MSGDDETHHGITLQNLKVMAIFVVLISGLLGASLPVLFAYFFKEESQQRKVQTVIKLLTCVSIGLVLATALIHMLPEGMYQLEESGVAIFKRPEHEEEHHDDDHNSTNSTNSSHNDTDDHDDHDEDEDDHDEHSHPYPYAFLFAMVGMTVVYIISTELSWYGMSKLKEVEGVDCDEEEEERQSSFIKLCLLEVGIVIHSVIIGVTLGVSQSDNAARTLVIVLCVHQLFEGLAVGSLAIQAQVSGWGAAFFVGLFGITTPIGIGIGMGVDKQDLVVQGVLYTLSAGILLHMALVEMLPHMLGSHSHHSHGAAPGGCNHGPLPLGKLVEHVHGKPTTPDADADAATKEAPSAIVQGENPLSGEEMKEKQQPDHACAHDHAHKHDDAAIAATLARREKRGEEAITKYNDDHKDDESFCFRVACYIAFIFGAAVQSVIGIWA